MTAVERSGVTIDVCAHCGNLWLDRGELEKIRARERQSDGDFDDAVSFDPPPPHDHRDQNAGDVEDHLDVEDGGDGAEGLLNGLAEWFNGLSCDDVDFD